MSSTLVIVRNDVRQLRLDKGLSQADLGTELGVSRQTVNSIEVERYTPSLALAMALARFFGRSVEEVFHDGDEG
jgi:putative transcriptional regulator